MEKLPDDLLEQILNYGSSQDFLNMCIVYPKFCQKEDIWMRRFKKDFGPFLIYIKQEHLKNIRQTYLNFVKKFDETVNEIFNLIIRTYDNIVKFLTKDFFDRLKIYSYNCLFQILIKLLKYIKKKQIENVKEEMLFDVLQDQLSYNISICQVNDLIIEKIREDDDFFDNYSTEFNDFFIDMLEKYFL